MNRFCPRNIFKFPCPPGRRYVHGADCPSPDRHLARRVALPVALSIATGSYALFALTPLSRPDTNDGIFSEWNFPAVRWRYSPKLVSGEPLDVVEADWASVSVVTLADVEAALMKLVFAWIDAHPVNPDSRNAHRGRFKGFEIIAALAACQLARREFISMETARLMHPGCEDISKHVSETEEAVWRFLAEKNPEVCDVSQVSDEVKIACLAAIVVEALQHTCGIVALNELIPIDTAEKEEKEEEILLRSSYWKGSRPAERIIISSFMCLAVELVDKTEVWEEARELGYEASFGQGLRFVEGWAALIVILLRLTRREIQRGMAEIVSV
ncbi:hypothetical protein FKW77_006332 [Venturia effusa]|uniref:Uncharacterized protein n=1 Tax=Venturia effusa TaxID=50376 RepID=A0A517KWK2_9PEZI|nr:hypothetical protein FKW77_006332 [Venturia effusa]